jgi:hypothetical protein
MARVEAVRTFEFALACSGTVLLVMATSVRIKKAESAHTVNKLAAMASEERLTTDI